MPHGDYAKTSTADLLARLHADRGDRAAWNELVERQGDGVYRLALQILGDPQLAEDAAQEAFLRMGQRAHQLRAADKTGISESTAKAWLNRIACRCALQISRRESRRRRRFI